RLVVASARFAPVSVAVVRWHGWGSMRHLRRVLLLDPLLSECGPVDLPMGHRLILTPLIHLASVSG
ncbi:hypothetical protein PMAYCL1PPCAC_25555, partial [Pristionchus mayeri]